ncbi:NUDIX hydrolase [Oceanobacillus kapialis]|uniref:NUDIX hydrolase n=1 Tax=Oceanobacillus kapialis TaxID=481353 RepID=UPI0038515732
MEKWQGAAGICLNEHNQLLMVLQGSLNEEKTWSVPSGMKEDGEDFVSCCIREVEEETGYVVEVIEKLLVKEEEQKELSLQVKVHYFAVKITGGAPAIQDPDQLIYEISWKSAEEVENLNLTYPNDKEFLLRIMASHSVR